MNPAARPASRPATLKDIARAVGVDISTVSKVLNGGGISVRPETHQAIVEEARRLRYRPHALARSLRGQRAGALGILLPDLTNPVYATIVRGAVRRAEEMGYVTLVAEVADESASTRAYARLVSERRIDGLIIASSADTAEITTAIDENPVPLVFVNRRVPKAGRSVTIDDEAAGRLAAETLIAAGHRLLGFIGASDDLDTARRRRAGFVGACRAAGLPKMVDAVAPYSRRGGYDACLQLIDGPRRPTGVFASNLLVGIGVLAALRIRGLTAPDDLSVVSLDAEDAMYTAPPLTAIRMPLDEMGVRAVEELDAVIRGRQPKDVVVDVAPTVVMRESVGAPPRQAGRES